jgi:hypothetical protein
VSAFNRLSCVSCNLNLSIHREVQRLREGNESVVIAARMMGQIENITRLSTPAPEPENVSNS